MFQVYSTNRAMERQELRLPAFKEEIRAAYKTLKGKKTARRIECRLPAQTDTCAIFDGQPKT